MYTGDRAMTPFRVGGALRGLPTMTVSADDPDMAKDRWIEIVRAEVWWRNVRRFEEEGEYDDEYLQLFDGLETAAFVIVKREFQVLRGGKAG